MTGRKRCCILVSRGAQFKPHLTLIGTISPTVVVWSTLSLTLCLCVHFFYNCTVSFSLSLVTNISMLSCQLMSALTSYSIFVLSREKAFSLYFFFISMSNTNGHFLFHLSLHSIFFCQEKKLSLSISSLFRCLTLLTIFSFIALYLCFVERKSFSLYFFFISMSNTTNHFFFHCTLSLFCREKKLSLFLFHSDV